MGGDALRYELKLKLVRLLNTHADMFRMETPEYDNRYSREYLDFLKWIDDNVVHPRKPTHHQEEH
jgi:hypothetical protein